MRQKKIYFFIGTIAELFKIAPIIRECEKRKIEFTLIDSGQNEIPLNYLQGFIKISKPHIQFPEKANKSSVYHFFFWALKTVFVALFLLRKEFKGANKHNTYFVIHGDTVTSLIGGLIAKFYRLTLVHVESGYLSFNFLEPFPEEICRSINIRMADVLFAPTDWAKNNLKQLNKITISTKQNTLIETCLWGMKQKVDSAEIKKFKKYYLLIMHRQEHVIFRKNWSRKTMDFVIKNSDKDLTCVLLNHPLTVNLIKSLDLGLRAKNVRLISQLAYPSFINLMKNAEFIATDGATYQQETYYMGKPLLALRDYTEQSEGMGGNVVLYKSDEKLMKEFLTNYKKYQRKPVSLQKRPAEIIIDYLFDGKI